MMKQAVLASSLLWAGAIVTGCASSTGHVNKTRVNQSSVVTKSVPAEALRPDIPDGAVLAVIRFPAIVETEAKDIFHRAYARRAIGGTPGRGVTNTIETVAVADSAVIKSNFYALSLFKELAAKLPEHSVLLSPHAIKLGEGGELTSEPMTAAEDLPSVVSIDFAAYSFPDSRRLIEDVPVTFGDLFTPLVTVRTDHRASAPNQGLLMASGPLISRAAAEGQETALETIKALQRGDLKPVIPELDFISYITNDTPIRVAVQSLSTRPEKNSTMVLPVEKVRIPASEMVLLEGASDGTIDPIDEVYTDAMSNRIIALINSLDADKAVMLGRAAKIAEFDPSLAALTFIGNGDADYKARLAYAERLLDAQRKYLSVQSLRIFDGINNGELGEQVRDMISAEQDILQQRRALAGQRNVDGISALAAIFTGGIMLAKSDPPQKSAELLHCESLRRSSETTAYDTCMDALKLESEEVRRECELITRSTTSEAFDECVTRNDPLVLKPSEEARRGRALMTGGIYTGIQAISKAELSHQLSNNFLNSIVPALEQQTTVTIDLLDSNETITAIRYEDLQSQLQDLYAEKQRALETVATQCAYLEAGGRKRGTWLGVCENGLANGSGVGVLEGSDEILEYYGYARDGYADGAGLMIKHSTIGSLSYEGSFSGGQPDGTVRVSQTGKDDAVRRFVKGLDQGPSKNRIVTPFDGLSSGAVN